MMRAWPLVASLVMTTSVCHQQKDDAPTNEGIGDLETEVDHLVDVVRDRFPEAYAEELEQLDTGARDVVTRSEPTQGR